MEVGGYIHAGRSSWDLAGIAQRLPIRTGLLEAANDLNDYRQALLDLAEQHVETVMPYYTHGQQAQPTTLAHHLHAFVCVAERDFRRLDRAYRTVNVSQAGAAAGTATRFPVNRERTANLLGFDTTARNTRDASVNHDYIWESAAAASLLAASLGALADELILWCGQEYGLIRMADRWCHTSSIMTQKRNPSAAERVQAIRKQLGGALAGKLHRAGGSDCARRDTAGVAAAHGHRLDAARQRGPDASAQQLVLGPSCGPGGGPGAGARVALADGTSNCRHHGAARGGGRHRAA